MGWNLNDSTTSLLPNISLFLEQNDCTPPKCGELSDYTDSAHTEVEDHSSRYMNGSNMYDRGGNDTRQLHPSCIACRGLPISQDWLNRMKIVRDRTIPIILPSGKDILADTMFKISVGYTNLGTRQIQCRLGSKVCLFIALNAIMAG